MHPTGIEPVPAPWKGAILPLNYGCEYRDRPSHSVRRMFYRDSNALACSRRRRTSTCYLSIWRNASITIGNTLPRQSSIHCLFAQFLIFLNGVRTGSGKVKKCRGRIGMVTLYILSNSSIFRHTYHVDAGIFLDSIHIALVVGQVIRAGIDDRRPRTGCRTEQGCRAEPSDAIHDEDVERTSKKENCSVGLSHSIELIRSAGNHENRNDNKNSQVDVKHLSTNQENNPSYERYALSYDE